MIAGITTVALRGAWRVLILLVLGAAAPAAAARPLTAEEDGVFRRTRDVLFGNPASLKPLIEWVEERGGTDLVASLILALRYMSPENAPMVSALLSRLTGHQDAQEWRDWMLWQEAHPEVEAHPSFDYLKLFILMQVDSRFDRFIRPLEPRGIRIEEIVWGGVRVDGIPSLDNPALVSAADAAYLEPAELVYGVEIGGDARAYPLRILDWHEMFNDVIGGVPVALAYCTLCGAGILFETQVEGHSAPLVFGSSGLLYRSNKLMFDRLTDSLWNQFTGRPVAGPLYGSGIELAIRPVTITSWQDWRTRHPDTRVLALETGHRRDYRPGAAYAAYFASPELMFPALVTDQRLARKDFVYGVRAFGGAKAWPVEAFRDRRVINDTVGFVEVVLIGNAATRTVRAYLRDGREFQAGGAPDSLVGPGGRWRVTEAALVGPDGTRLARVPGHLAYWFAWAGYLGEEAALYEPPG